MYIGDKQFLLLFVFLGRKNVQTRLVEPTAMSVSSGDIFILVGEKDLFLWQGKEANVLEKARVRISFIGIRIPLIIACVFSNVTRKVGIFHCILIFIIMIKYMYSTKFKINKLFHCTVEWLGLSEVY